MSLLAKLRYKRVLRSLAGPKILNAFAAGHPEAFFVEVGANDGDQHDHLRPHILAQRWRGIMVEPVPYVFALLMRNYADVPGVILENAAIADRDGTLPFFHVAQPEDGEAGALPSWYDAIGSFSRPAILSHAAEIPDIADRIVETEVPALRFDSLLAKHGVERVDLVLVDTEGYDWEVIKTIDLERHRPRLLVYEHYHLSPEDRADCLAHLRRHGYETLEEGLDTFSLDPRPDALTERWRRLKPGVPGASKHDRPA